MFLDRGHPCFCNFYPTIPVDAVRVKSHANRLLDSACVPMRITIVKLYFIPKQVVSCVMGVVENGGGLGRGESGIGLPISPM